MKFFAVTLSVLLLVLCGFVGTGFVDAGGVHSKPVPGQQPQDKQCPSGQTRYVQPGKCTTVNGRKNCLPDIVQCRRAG